MALNSPDHEQVVRLDQFYSNDAQSSPLLNQSNSYNMDNIGDDVDVADAVVSFGNSVYEGVHLVVNKKDEINNNDAEEREMLDEMNNEHDASTTFDNSQSRLEDLDISIENLEEMKQLKNHLKIAKVKNSILKKRIGEITNKIENIHNESKQRLQSISDERQKVEQKNIQLQEDLVSVKEDLLFVRKQLESKSAKVLALENELLYSKQSMVKLQDEVTRLREERDQQQQQQLLLQQQQISQENAGIQTQADAEDFKVEDFSAISASAISAETVGIDEYEAKAAEADHLRAQLDQMYPQYYELQKHHSEVLHER